MPQHPFKDIDNILLTFDILQRLSTWLTRNRTTPYKMFTSIDFVSIIEVTTEN